MPEQPRSIHDLEAQDQLRHQRREWIAERIGWGVMALLLLAGMAGLLGQGPLSRDDETSADGKLSLEYERVHRVHAPACLRIRIEQSPSGGPVQLAIARSFDDATIQDEIVPRPSRVESGDGELVYFFDVTGDQPEQLIELRYQYDQFGRFDHALGLRGQEPLRFRQIILP